MTTRPRIVGLLFLLGAACATAGGAGQGGVSRYKQADFRIPDGKTPAGEIEEEALRGKLDDAGTHVSRGLQAQESGNSDQARAEFVTAADIYRSALDMFRSTEWRMPYAYRTAQLYLSAGKPEDAAGMATRIVTDPAASDASKALGAHLAATAWQQLALAQVKAGQLEAVLLPNAEQRAGKPLAPRTPPGAWKRFVDAADTYVQHSGADPGRKKNEGAAGSAAGQLALVAAEVHYAFDNMEEARRRFETVLQRWPAEAGVAEAAVPLLLQTYLVQKDEAGYRNALAALRKSYEGAPAGAHREKMLGLVGQFEAGASFKQGSDLLAQGKAEEAAEQFEAIATRYPEGADAPTALYNASIAWTKAGKRDKAVAAASRILEKYPDSKVASGALLSLASVASRADDHKTALARYTEFLTKYPEAPNRCLALQNVGYENDRLGNKTEAAARYLAFGTDPACAKEDPNTVALTLYRAGTLFQGARQKAKALEAFTAASKLQGVTDEVAKSQVEDAKRIAKKAR